MAPEPFETDLLREADTLDTLCKLFQGFISLLDRTVIDNAGFLDEDLVEVLAIISTEATILLDDTVKLKKKKIPGLKIQLADVMDQIHVLQVGLPTKGGVKDEDL